ncbi:MAG: rod shape-determining protein MreD [Candidatus Saganbacteria bacterium]|nr:rod shape-determining protein MreD [Candidatus Saganbacteria bacterium]
MLLLLVIVLQTVVFSRLPFFNVTPDIMLVLVVCYAVVEQTEMAFAAAALVGLVQDIMGSGIYLNTVSKLLAASVVSTVRESFLGEEFSLSALMVAVLTPSILLVEAVLLYSVADRSIDWMILAGRIALTTVYNLLFVPLLLPLVDRAFKEQRS